ncbi:MAG: hypothetical protein RRC07_15675 [Anaerolineae bacterium]|nr:hypothetical protein [Anaerolineae bacterium]
MAAEERLLLRAVQVGMPVYNAAEERLGTVEAIYAAVADPNGDPLSDAEMSGTPVAWARGNTWAESLALLAGLPAGEVFPKELARRLVQSGFLCVEGEQLSGRDQLVGCYRVAEVRDDGVFLYDEEQAPEG